MVDEVAKLASQQPAGDIPATGAISAAVQAAFTKIGEKMGYTRGVKLSGAQVGEYKHYNNKVGVIIALEGQADPEALREVCMHIAFNNPMGISREDIPAEVIEKEKRIAKAQAIEQGKPEQIAEKMVAGKINKFYQDNCLMEQPFVKDPAQTVKQVLGGAMVKAFARFQVGSQPNVVGKLG